MMVALGAVHPDWHIMSLRYFNPVGAHSSGLIGDEPTVYPANLIPYIQEVAIGKRPILTIFGGDYDTRDKTCIRDYVHITDLAEAHAMAVDKVAKLPSSEVKVYNLGSGTGYSVKEIVAAYSKALGKEIPCQIGDRRKGDAQQLIANVDKATAETGWRTKRTLEDMCRDSVKFLKLRYGV